MSESTELGRRGAPLYSTSLLFVERGVKYQGNYFHAASYGIPFPF